MIPIKTVLPIDLDNKFYNLNRLFFELHYLIKNNYFRFPLPHFKFARHFRIIPYYM